MVLDNPWLIYPLAALVGLCFGSLISLLSYRLPRDLPVLAARSRCPHCQTPLMACDLIPVLSYVMARATCRHCEASLSWRYPVIEVVTAALFMLLLYLHGPSWETLALAGLTVAILTLIVADLESYLIPDEIQIALAVLAALHILLTGADWQDRLMAAALAGGLAWGLRIGYRRLRGREGLGLGDVKFFAVAGLWLGLAPLPVFLFLSGLIGILTALLWKALGRGKLFPFGPALAVALWLCVCQPEWFQFAR